MVPIIIGFLASLIGLGGIGQKIRAIVETLQKPVNKALDFVIKTGLKLAGPIIRGIKGISGKVKAKVAAGKAWVKGKVEAGKQWAKSKIYGGDDSPEGKQKRLTKGMATGVAAVNKYAGNTVGEKMLRPMLGLIGKRHGLAVLEPVAQGPNWAVHGEVQRAKATTNAKTPAAGVDFTKAPASSLLKLGLNRDEVRHIFSQSTTDKVKSAIMEGLLAKAKMSPQAKADKGKGGKKPASANEPQPEFIAGRRINMGGAEFSDGILAILGMSKANQPVVKVLKIFEAKGGERQKYKVGKENERYSRIPTTRDPDTGENEKDRLRREVVDQLIAEHHPEALDDTLTPEQATKAHQEAKAKVLAKFRRKIPKLMAKTYREATTGQAVRDRERLGPNVEFDRNETGEQPPGRKPASVPTVLTIDGVPRTVVGYSPRNLVTVVVLPSDIKPGKALPAELAGQKIKAEFETVGITAAKLATLAAAVRRASR